MAYKLGIRALLAAVLVALAGAASAAEIVNLYSARKEALIRPLLDRFSAETGIQVNLVTGKADALLQRLRSEGRNSPADLLLTTDAGRLYRAKKAGVLAAVQSEILDSRVPANYRDPEGYWYGLSVRARPIVYVRDRVDPAELSTYEALAEPKWKGRICIRSSNNIYNQSLVASMIASRGVEATEAWARGLVRNLARPPRGGDRDQIRAAAAGQCDLAVVNTYYLAIMLHDPDPAQQAAARRVAVFWPNQDDRGTHVNVSGIALTKAASHREAAVRLMEYLSGDEAQAWYASTNHEYPIRRGIEISETLKAWGTFRADTLNLDMLGRYNAEAVRLMDRAGWK
ncbi:Fe(3+) ABC transporter substrate-binding protein [Thiohalobacter sp. IOR34]|uniref:Fe(3+) ABC transporter substrate-binding protein n=1 Tax=Thiohalobacter sp. IOR34 TaxID=3057176 RepID=UPI0025B20CE5|nr:Fe(3+) ABC transporter substrate-binding protein [Thiohalobacter sp. IOR34]WJW76097.1 Fe(3+) ABC transporter substrate-binding protein [Thiohalobacter sp. IOR34]